MQAGQLDLQFDGYRSYWNYAEKKGYSGTAIYTRHEPLSAAYGIGIADHDTEGRVITLEYDTFYLVTVYVPNSQDGLRRLDYRMSWEDDFRAYLKGLDSKKPVVVCGDLNVAHREIDLKNPKTNRRNAGFTDEERGKMTELLDAGFTDTFRHFHPDTPDIYSWWSYRFHAREKNAGWRIDYFLTSARLDDKLQDAKYTPRFSAQTIVPWRSTLICRPMVKKQSRLQSGIAGGSVFITMLPSVIQQGVHSVETCQLVFAKLGEILANAVDGLHSVGFRL